MSRAIHVFILLGIFFISSISFASAAEFPRGVFQMHDGAYFYPADGFLTTSLDEMLMHLGTTTTSAIASTTTLPLKQAITRAQALLAVAPTSPQIAATDDVWRTVTLAIWNPIADEFRTVTLQKKGTQLRALADPITHIRVARSNGVNSEFTVAGGDIVLALRYPIVSNQHAVHQTVVYTPYSRALHTPEMVAEGKRWLDETVAGVFANLRRDGIRSRAASPRLLADVIDPEFVKRIILIEHLDERVLTHDARRQIEAFFVTLAANEDAAYNFARSKAGALGLVQFIPKTYAALARWPSLHLAPDFERGMRDPKNAIRAQIAYLDYLLSRLPDDVRASGTPREHVEEVVAATYNGGATRVVRALQVWEENFDPRERLKVKSRSRLKLETMKYVLKLRALRDKG